MASEEKKDKRFIDIFINRPVLSTVISLMILILGLRAMGLLSVQQYPTVESALVTISTAYTGADPETITAFVTTPIEDAVAQASGIDYMTSNSAANTSMIQANLLLNYDPDKALTEINTQVNSVLNQLPTNAQIPSLSVTIAQSIANMYIGFYSDALTTAEINDYLLRAVVQKLQAIHGVQQAQILGNNQFALRAWLDPVKLAGYGLSTQQVASILKANNFVAAAGRTDGQMFIVNYTASTALNSVDEFKNLVIKSDKNTIIRLKDVAKVEMGSQNYNTSVRYNGKPAVYISITVTPGANLLTVLNNVRQTFAQIQQDLPNGLNGTIVYDSSVFVQASISEVIQTLFEAFVIVAVVIFLFLGSLRALSIPLIAIPLSIIGTFFLMLLLGYSINILTLLALVLAIGLVVDDAIIVVENVCRHMGDGKSAYHASILSARELCKPIVAISVVLIAVYLPIGFMGGLTGALFTEFAFTLASAVGISAVIALTLSPVMCAHFLKNEGKKPPNKIMAKIDKSLERLRDGYHNRVKHALGFLPVVVVFAVVILASNYFLFVTSQSELAPQEDQGIINAMASTEANASLQQTAMYAHQITIANNSLPAVRDSFTVLGISGSNNAPTLNSALTGVVFKPWDERKLTTNQMQPMLQKKLNQIAGAKVAAFQPPSLPGGGAGLPVQFVIETSDNYSRLNTVLQEFLPKVYQTGDFTYVDPDLKIDQWQSSVQIDRDKASEFGLTMNDIGQSLSAALSENYLNYFNYSGWSYQVIPQMNLQSRLNQSDLYHYYVQTAQGMSIPLATFVKLKNTVVPESINHFQGLNSTTISAVLSPATTMGKALADLRNIAAQVLPQGYSINYAGQSRQFMQESSSLLVTFGLALIIIFLSLAVLFDSFRDPLIVLISVPMSICGAMIFISMGIGGASLNIYTEVGLVTLIGLISKHGILIVEFANDCQKAGMAKFDAALMAAKLRFRPILMTTCAMVLGVIPLVFATGAGAVSRFDIGLVISTGISIGTLFTLFVVPAMYVLIAEKITPDTNTQLPSDI